MKKTLLYSLILSLNISYAQDSLQFDKIVQWDANPIESQGKTGTCWSFSTTSFLESELIRMGKGTYNLSEMFVARQTYLDKADNYVRRHGKTQFGEGSLGHDMINAIETYGIVPKEVFSGLQSISRTHNHAELSNILKAYLEAIVENKGGELSVLWREGYTALLDVYLGEFPESFIYQEEIFSPKSFSTSLGLSADNYLSLTSYTHEPYYSSFILGIPDNWSNGLFHNLPIDLLYNSTKNALKNGFTIEWDTDVSNSGFNSKKGLALVAIEGEKPNFNLVSNEMEVSQAYRQEAFDNYAVGDDHLMHIVGLVEDPGGKEYFVVKNSWGDKIGMEGFKGHILVSESYFKLNTISVLMHRDGLSNIVKKKLNLKYNVSLPGIINE